MLLEVSQISLYSVHHYMGSPYLQSQKKYIFLWKKYIYFCGNIYITIYKKNVLKCWDCKGKEYSYGAKSSY